MARIVKINAPATITGEQKAALSSAVQDYFNSHRSLRRTDNLAFTVGAKAERVTVRGTYQHAALRRTITYTVTAVAAAEAAAKAQDAESAFTPVKVGAERQREPMRVPPSPKPTIDNKPRTAQAIRQARIASAHPAVAKAVPEQEAPKVEEKKKAAPVKEKKKAVAKKETAEEKLARMLKSGAIERKSATFIVKGGDKFKGKDAILKAIRAGKI